ncbi:FAD-dependent oxidoreductase [Leucobacter sp. M11]|uniref:FAD-dependent oxidoreductase n=1 Tax=Leucobacter sp. M11 TaxID=2993565 RepID=UPI002D80D33A|nr:FAD-dependent oxidoreductase [Leucobacter sp. M11]MEB4614637.1 FAD-dependent oxidoreductase [Leucobacter sp. M11]
MSKLRIAIVGAGPAGIYAADLLLKAERDFEVSIDLFDRLPAPYGLVRYGVSPDHPRIKGIINALREVLDRGDIRFFGNVDFGTDLTIDDLRRHYHAVIFATGAISDAPLAIPGIDAKGSYGAADFVSWFDGHPDVPRTWPLEAREVAVIGNGNVALDVSRMLIKHADDLLPTEIPDNVYAGLKENPITDLHLFGRRGPAYVKFTPLELRELGEVRDVDMVLNPADFEHADPHAEALVAGNKQALVISRVMNKWLTEQAERDAADGPGASRRLHMHFWSKPVAVVTEPDAEGTPRVTAIRVERTAPDGLGGIVDTGEIRDIPVQSLYRAVGYFGSALDEVPFDGDRGVIPNDGGRVRDAEGTQVPGVYATGWIKRGPVGLIGHTKSDAMETIEGLLADRGQLWTPGAPEEDAITALLDERGVPVTTVEGWHRLDAHEIALGEAVGRPRIKVVPREDMTAVSRGEEPRA